MSQAGDLAPTRSGLGRLGVLVVLCAAQALACEAPLVFERAVVVEAPAPASARLRRAEAVAAELGQETLRQLAREAVPGLGAGSIQALSLEPRLVELPAQDGNGSRRAQVFLQLRLRLRGAPQQAERVMDAAEAHVRAALARPGQAGPPLPTAAAASSGR